MKAMIFAAGLGTRLRPLTDTQPKALVKVAGKPLLAHAIENCFTAGAEDIVINTHHFIDQITAFAKAYDGPAKLSLSYEREKPLDTGGGLKKAAHFFDDGQYFLVYNTDIVTDMDLRALVNTARRSNALAVLAVRRRDTSRYLCFDASKRLSGWINIKSGEHIGEDGNRLAFSGIHVIHPRIFKLMPSDNIFNIIRFYLSLLPHQKILGYEQLGGVWFDAGKPQSLAAADDYLMKKT